MHILVIYPAPFSPTFLPINPAIVAPINGIAIINVYISFFFVFMGWEFTHSLQHSEGIEPTRPALPSCLYRQRAPHVHVPRMWLWHSSVLAGVSSRPGAAYAPCAAGASPRRAAVAVELEVPALMPDARSCSVTLVLSTCMYVQVVASTKHGEDGQVALLPLQ